MNKKRGRSATRFRRPLAPESPFHPIEPRRVLVDTRRCIAFLDKYPVSRGHTLVVAKIVTSSLFGLPIPLQSEVWKMVTRVRTILKKRYNPDGFNIGINDGVTAGQTLPHAHVHVIPRYRNDVHDPRGGIRWIFPKKARYW